MFGAAILLPLIGLLIALAIQIGEGIYDIFTGVAQEFIEFPQGAFIGALSGAKVVHAMGVFGITNFICGLKMLQNATSCGGYYIMQLIGKLLYLIFMIIFMIFDFISGKAKLGSQIEKQIWKWLEDADTWTSIKWNIHIIYFPKSVRDKCFNCRRLKTSAFVRKTGDFMNDMTEDVIPLTTGGFSKMFGGFEKIMKAFGIL
tara:strand:+ start:1598 stop:2200 length:603 start_codon:yes stop_codon:yes gene_type:complete